MDDVSELFRGAEKKKGKGKIKSQEAAQNEWRLMFPMAEKLHSASDLVRATGESC